MRGLHAITLALLLLGGYVGAARADVACPPSTATPGIDTPVPSATPYPTLPVKYEPTETAMQPAYPGPDPYPIVTVEPVLPDATATEAIKGSKRPTPTLKETFPKTGIFDEMNNPPTLLVVAVALLGVIVLARLARR